LRAIWSFSNTVAICGARNRNGQGAENAGCEALLLMLERKASHSDDQGIMNPALASSKKEKFMLGRFSPATWLPRQEASYLQGFYGPQVSQVQKLC
jgi:hypothetical protein